MSIIFIIGPGGVGKTTCGKILAKNIGYNFIDLDTEFCKKIKNITKYIEYKGYKFYCYKNSILFENILTRINEDTVFVLSSGFLVHEGIDDLVKKHLRFIKRFGVSILLLPSVLIEDGIDIIIERQMNRGWKLNRKKEYLKFKDRFVKYKKYGDVKVFSCERPELIANLMQKELKDMEFVVR